MKSWAMDVLHLLPDDREEALLIVKAHTPGDIEADDRRRVNKLCRQFYRRLEITDLLQLGDRFLRVVN